MLFGSVANRDIADGVTAAGFTVDRRQVILDKPIKALGLHKVRVALHPEVIVTVTANVAKSEDEAVQQDKLGTAVIKAEGGEAPDLDKLHEEAAQAQAEAGTGEHRKSRLRAHTEMRTAAQSGGRFALSPAEF